MFNHLSADGSQNLYNRILSSLKSITTLRVTPVYATDVGREVVLTLVQTALPNENPALINTVTLQNNTGSNVTYTINSDVVLTLATGMEAVISVERCSDITIAGSGTLQYIVNRITA